MSIVSFSFPSIAQIYKVQVAAYETSVASDYFSGYGLENITMQKDHNDIYKYYYGSVYTSQADAEAAQATLVSKGFPNAQVIDMDKYKACTCGYKPPAPTVVTTSTYKDKDMVGIIYFDFDKATLRQKSKNDLDELYSVMVKQPEFNVVLRAHTDSKGSNDYNEKLSQRRGKAAQQYLINKGISASRISVLTSGETDPAAKNEIAGGIDSPQGRQFNRRVEFILTTSSGAIQSDMIRDVKIPTHLLPN